MSTDFKRGPQFVQAIVTELLELFCAGGNCAPPFPEAELAVLTAPAELKAMLRLSGEWHISQEHCGVFGFNMFSSQLSRGGATPWLNKVDIIGDDDMVTEWQREHSSPNCAEDDWQCIAAVSEFDYIFVCTTPGHIMHGATRRMVNNCFEDTPFTPGPFSRFLQRLTEFAKAYHDNQGEDLQFFNFFAEQ